MARPMRRRVLLSSPYQLSCSLVRSLRAVGGAQGRAREARRGRASEAVPGSEQAQAHQLKRCSARAASSALSGVTEVIISMASRALAFRSARDTIVYASCESRQARAQSRAAAPRRAEGTGERRTRASSGAASTETYESSELAPSSLSASTSMQKLSSEPRSIDCPSESGMAPETRAAAQAAGTGNGGLGRAGPGLGTERVLLLYEEGGAGESEQSAEWLEGQAASVMQAMACFDARVFPLQWHSRHQLLHHELLLVFLMPTSSRSSSRRAG